MNTFRQNNHSPFPLFLVAALFILASPIFWMGVEAPGQERSVLPPENADLYFEIAPVMHYGFSRLRTGDLPLWNDRQLCGTPFFANPVHGLLQPLNLGFLFLDTPRALVLHAFLSLALMGFFFVVFMRSMSVSHVPAALGGIVYMCCGATAAAMSRPGVANALVWLPLACWALREYYRKPHPARLLLGSVILALLLLSGSPVMILVALGFCGAYACCLASFGFPATDPVTSRITRFGSPLLLLLISLALTSVQWLPTLAWVSGLATPSDPLDRFAVAGVMPQGLVPLVTQLLQAHPGTLPALGYVGIITLLLVPAAFLHGIPRWERGFHALSALCLLLAASLLGNGSSTGIWAALIYPACFAMAVLAALGADRLFLPRRSSHTPRLWGPLILVAGVSMVVFLVAPAATRGRMVPLVVSLVLFALFRVQWTATLSGIILILFLFVDLSTASVNYHGHPFFSGGAALSLPAETATLLRDTALDERIAITGKPLDGLHGNIGMRDGFRVVGSAGAPLTPDQVLWWETLNSEPHEENMAVSNVSRGALLTMMAVRAIVAPDDDNRFSDMRLRKQGAYNGINVYLNENAVPRLSWASSWRLATDMPAAISALTETSFDPRRECIVLPLEPANSHLTRTVPTTRETNDQPSALESKGTRFVTTLDTPERLIISVNNAAPGVLVVSDTFAPGWHASVNGQQVPILKTNGLFRGIALGPGEHEIIFDYKPYSFIAGATISVISLCVLFLTGLGAVVLRRRR